MLSFHYPPQMLIFIPGAIREQQRFLQVLVLSRGGDRRLALIFHIMPSMFPPAAQGSRQHEPGKKQVAMIAQKVVDANQTHRQRRALVTFANPRTTTFWAFLKNHSC
jgi:hypothetical protein